MPTLPRPLTRCNNIHNVLYLHHGTIGIMPGRTPAPMPCYGRPPPPGASPDKKFRSKTGKNFVSKNVPNWEHLKTSREPVIASSEMSDDDRDRSPTPPVGPPNDLPTMISFSEKQEVSSPHLIAISPSRLHYGVPAHRAYTPVSLPLGTHKLQSWRPMGTPLRVPAPGYLAYPRHTPI